MTFILISNDDAFIENITDNLKDSYKKSKIYTSNFNSDKISKIFKFFEDSLLTIVYSKDNNISSEQMATLSFTAGYLKALEVPLFTNVVKLNHSDIIKNKDFKCFESDKEIVAQISKEVSKLVKKSESKSAKKVLLKKGIPFTSDCFGLYITKAKEEICDLFIQAGIDINSKDDLGTPMLNLAIRNDNLGLVEKFINLGADLNIVSDDRGYTPVMDAVWRGNFDITNLLIKKGADLNTINKEGQTNLILAVGANKVDIVKILAENGADPDIKDSMGMSAYGYASLFKKEEILNILSPYHKS